MEEISALREQMDHHPIVDRMNAEKEKAFEEWYKRELIGDIRTACWSAFKAGYRAGKTINP